MDDDTEDPRLCKTQTSQKTEKSSRWVKKPKNKKNVPKRCAQKKELIDVWSGSSINTVAEEFISSENIAS